MKSEDESVFTAIEMVLYNFNNDKKLQQGLRLLIIYCHAKAQKSYHGCCSVILRQGYEYEVCCLHGSEDSYFGLLGFTIV
jgi:hypothetical protein